MSKEVTLKELHPNNTKGNGSKVGKLVKSTKRYAFYKFDHNKQVIRVKTSH